MEFRLTISPVFSSVENELPEASLYILTSGSISLATPEATSNPSSTSQGSSSLPRLASSSFFVFSRLELGTSILCIIRQKYRRIQHFSGSNLCFGTQYHCFTC
ncbi:unnamed protein product, partial [Vitis vinifera]